MQIPTKAMKNTENTNGALVEVKPNRTPNYRFTIEIGNPSHMEFLKEFRKKFYSTGKYVKLNGRWGKKNPNYRTKSNIFHRGGISFAPLDLARYADVYVYKRY